MLQRCLSGPSEQRCEFGPGVGGCHIDHSHGLAHNAKQFMQRGNILSGGEDEKED